MEIVYNGLKLISESVRLGGSGKPRDMNNLLTYYLQSGKQSVLTVGKTWDKDQYRLKVRTHDGWPLDVVETKKMLQGLLPCSTYDFGKIIFVK
ncbi:MAG: hypothetical protein HYS80_02115 [Candidatus Aenigmarchaeota archaeon]|nr:hypothetical protein [Candidatus Aenigmarchaeota archaeon]